MFVMVTEEELANMNLKQAKHSMDNDPHQIQTDYLRDQRAANLLDQINPDRLMEDIEHRLRGEKYDRMNGWIARSSQSVMVSEKLIDNFMGFLGAVLTQNVSMSNFSANEINAIMVPLISWVSRDLEVNHEEYGLKENYTEMDRIGHIILISCFSTFKQAQNGMLARRIFNSMNVDASLTQHKKPGIKDALMFWK